MAKAKVGIIGAGNVGSSLAYNLATKEISDVILYDIIEGMPKGKALDICQSRYPDFFECNIKGTNEFSDIEDCDIVIITAGVPRKPGMSREDLIDVNFNIIKDVCLKIKQFKKIPIVIVVTNPLDVMTYAALKILEQPREKVIGMAGVLDSGRMAHFIAEKLNVSIKDIRAMVLGSHGDSMIGLPQYTTVSGIPITELMSKDDIEEIINRTKNGGAEIVSFLKTASAYYAPSSSTSIMVESILRDENRLLPCAVYLNGEYGIKDVVIGVPAIIGENGVKKIIEVKMTDEQMIKFRESAEIIRNNIKLLKF